MALNTQSMKNVEETNQKTHKFLIHQKNDDVGVVTTPIKKGEQVTGVFMDDDSKIDIKANDSIPLGHKISLKDIENGKSIIEYGVQIGTATCKWSKGDYVHTHNIKTSRW